MFAKTAREEFRDANRQAKNKLRFVQRAIGNFSLNKFSLLVMLTTPDRPTGQGPPLSPASYTSWDELLNHHLPHFSLL